MLWISQSRSSSCPEPNTGWRSCGAVEMFSWEIRGCCCWKGKQTLLLTSLISEETLEETLDATQCTWSYKITAVIILTMVRIRGLHSLGIHHYILWLEAKYQCHPWEWVVTQLSQQQVGAGLYGHAEKSNKWIKTAWVKRSSNDWHIMHLFYEFNQVNNTHHALICK